MKSEAQKQAQTRYVSSHRVELAAKSRRWAKAHPEQVAASVREYYLIHAYGITQKGYEDLVAKQGGKCGVCGRSLEETIGKGRPHVDHDHETGKVRGILCHFCNVGLGNLGDSIEILEAAIAYLRRSRCE